MQAAYVEACVRLNSFENRAAIAEGEAAQAVQQSNLTNIATKLGLTTSDVSDVLDGQYNNNNNGGGY